jgi:short-subunit dehydrogenase
MMLTPKSSIEKQQPFTLSPNTSKHLPRLPIMTKNHIKKCLVLGASSYIARAFCDLALSQKTSLILAGRNLDQLHELANDMATRFSQKAPPCFLFDALAIGTHETFIKNVLEQNPDLDSCLIACGTMPEQEMLIQNPQACSEMLNTNFVGLISIMNLLTQHFKNKNRGTLSCISSVAGDRGRKSNYLYGSSKAALNVYLDGLRHALFQKPILIQTVKPGPVKTPMTEGMKDLPFLTSPQKVAADIWDGIQSNKEIIYTPKRWRLIMKIITLLPGFLFKRSNL